jgi:hypothetical protein
MRDWDRAAARKSSSDREDPRAQTFTVCVTETTTCVLYMCRILYAFAYACIILYAWQRLLRDPLAQAYTACVPETEQQRERAAAIEKTPSHKHLLHAWLLLLHASCTCASYCMRSHVRVYHTVCVTPPTTCVLYMCLILNTPFLLYVSSNMCPQICVLNYVVCWRNMR